MNSRQDASLACCCITFVKCKLLKYMRKFAEAYPDLVFVQALPAQISWTHHIILLDKFADEELQNVVNRKK